MCTLFPLKLYFLFKKIFVPSIYSTKNCIECFSMFFCGPSSFWYDHCNLFCGIFFLDIIAWTLTNVVYDLKSTIREIEKVAILPCPVTTTSTKFSSFNFWTQADVCSCHISPTCFETLLLIHFNFLRVQSGTAAQILNFFNGKSGYSRTAYVSSFCFSILMKYLAEKESISEIWSAALRDFFVVKCSICLTNLERSSSLQSYW